MTEHTFGVYWLAFFGAITIRYFFIAGGTHVLCHSVLDRLLAHRGIILKPPAWPSIRKDAELSVLSAVIFAFFAALIMVAYNWGITRLYTEFNVDELWYFAVSFGVVLLIQDTYFYFIHRLFHHPLIFRQLHWGHHRSGEPTPWTSFAFDPPEALAQALFLVAIVFVIPLHFITLLAVVITMTAWGVFNHAGFKLFPSSLVTSWLGRWFIGSGHHLVHHRKYKVHYGLYFTHWDKLLGTDDPRH